MEERITIRVTADMKEALERFHRHQTTPLRSRQDGFRHIIVDWLARQCYLPISTEQQDVH